MAMACAMAARSASGAFGMARVHFLARARFELVDQVVRLHALALAAAHFDVRPLGVFGRNFVAHFEGAARRERHHVVGEMLQVVGLFGVSQRAQRRHHHLLRIRLPRIDHVEHFVRVAEGRGARIAPDSARGRPDLVAVGMLVETAVVEIARRAGRISRDGWRCPFPRK